MKLRQKYRILLSQQSSLANTLAEAKFVSFFIFDKSFVYCLSLKTQIPDTIPELMSFDLDLYENVSKVN